MRKLVDLFAETKRLPIAEQSQYIRARLPEAVADQGLKFWRPGDPIPRASDWVRIGVATWSRYDLELVDAIAESKQRSQSRDEQVEIFDVDELFHNPADPTAHFETYVPGIGKVFNPPVLGVWRAGELVTRLLDSRRVRSSSGAINWICQPSAAIMAECGSEKAP